MTNALEVAFPEKWADQMAQLTAVLEPETRKEIHEELLKELGITPSAEANASVSQDLPF